jgi:hypothetical protein
MAGEFLVPLLKTSGGAPDPVAIETWHLALGSTVAIEIPHDLFALWLYPARGGAILLGPAALGADHLDVPVPAPMLVQDDLFRLEETLRRAKYPSAIAAAIRQRDGSRDVGAMLLGSFEKKVFGPREALALRRLGSQLGPTMEDLAARLGTPSATLLERGLTRDEIPEHLARVACEAADGPDLVRRASGSLYELIPHDRLEILATGHIPGTLVPLSGAVSRRRWTGTESAGPFGEIVARFGEAGSLLVADLEALDGLRWALESPPVPLHGLLGVRLMVGGETAGYVLLGSVAREAFRAEDEEILSLVGLLLAPRVQALRAAGPVTSLLLSPPEAPMDDPPLPRAAASLAGTAEFAEGLRRFGEELGRMLPHDGVSIHLRRGEWEVVTLDPSLPRPLADLPAIPLEGFPGHPVLEEERDWISRIQDHREEIFVPLVVAGKKIGALEVRTRGTMAGRAAAAIARQFADVLAPHVELVRRSGIKSQPPFSLTSSR